MPCASVHTFCMRFLIDVMMLDRSGRVLKLQRSVRPWRAVTGRRGAHAVLEVPAEAAVDVEEGDMLRLMGAHKPQASVQFLMPITRPVIGVESGGLTTATSHYTQNELP